jgi:flagellar motor switch protein FliN/FliY
MSGTSDQSQIPPDGGQIATQTMDFWAESLAGVLESMTANRPNIEVLASTSSGWEEGFSWWGQRLSILEQPSFWIGAPAESWAALGRLTLSALGVDDPTDGDIEATCRDVMAQTSAMVASQLTRQFGTEITGGDSIPSNQPDAVATPVFKWSLDAGLISMEGTAVWSEAFLSRCSALTPPPTEEESEPEESSPASDSETPLSGGPADSMPRLDLRVEFILGRTALPLREIFKLNVGSVIELDHSAIEPAEVVIHGRVLARGQVVVVNGNYGLKIVPPQG